MMNQVAKPRIPRPFAAAPGLLRQVLLSLLPALVVSLLLSTSIWTAEPANASTTQCPGEEESKDYLVYVADTLNSRVQVFDSSGNFLRTIGSVGTGDGQVRRPAGIAIGSGGNVYVADTLNSRVQVFDSSGNFLRTIGSVGTGDGQVRRPAGIAIGSGGNVYVADTLNSRVQVFDSSGNFLRTIGSVGTGDGQVRRPAGIAIGSGGNVYVADTLNSRVQVFDSSGNFLRTIGSVGTGDGQVRRPAGIAIGSGGNVYVADTLNSRVQVFDSSGNFLRTIGSVGTGDGQVRRPAGIAIGSGGNVYVADTLNSRVQVFDSSGNFLRTIGSVGTGDGQVRRPAGIAIGSGGSSKPPFITPNCEASAVGSGAPVAVDARRKGGGTTLYLTQYNARDWIGDLKSFGINDDGNPGDRLWSAATQLNNGVPAANSRVLLTWGKPAGGKEPKTDSDGMAFRWDNLWPSQRQDLLTGTDSGGGEFFTTETTWGSFGSGNGQFWYPNGIATDSKGNVYVADTINHRVQKFDGAGNFLAKWGSECHWPTKRTPQHCYDPDGAGPLALGDGQFSYPFGIAIDSKDNVYVGSGWNNHRVQKFDSQGNFLAKWGAYGNGDGQFKRPRGIAIDGADNVYVTDTDSWDKPNNRVQKFDSAGNFLSKFGSTGNDDGQFPRRSPHGIAVDNNGNIYVSDTLRMSNHHRMQKFDSAGNFLGKWGSYGHADGRFNEPRGVAVDQDGNIYVAEMGNQQIQKFDSSGNFLMKSEWKHGVRLKGPSDIAVHNVSACETAIYVLENSNRVSKITVSKSAGGSNEAMARARLDYLRGNKSNEGNKGYKFRKRESLLGAIVHSRAVYVGKPMLGWPGAKYAKFKTTHLDREPIIYVGANDGALHGFKAKDGKEVIGYFPASVFDTASNAGLHYFSDPAYRHSYLVDGTPVVNDAFINNKATGKRSWRTVLVGTLRGGGRGLFALDVTNPAAFSEANAKSVVMWEFNNTHDAHLGYTFSEPTITLMNNGRWAAITGNGYEDTADGDSGGQAQLFIIYLDGAINGEWAEGRDYLRISTGAGSSAKRNGLATPAVVDLNGDGTADRAYAGDLEGNLWAFDLSDRVPVNWEVAYGTKAQPEPVFVARSEDGTAQPITVEPVVTRQKAAPGEPGPNLMVYFGTGKNIVESDKTNTTSQSFYGVWDRRQGSLARNALARQKILFESVRAGGKGRVTDPDLNVDYQWKDDTHYGWYLDLPATGERVVSDPKVRGNTVFFNTTIPDAASCGFGGKGWMMSVATHNGGSPEKNNPVFDFDEDGAITRLGDTVVFRDRRYAYAGKMFDSDGAPAGPSLVATMNRHMRYTVGDKTAKIDAALLNEVQGLTGRIAWQQAYPEIAQTKHDAADTPEKREERRNK